MMFLIKKYGAYYTLHLFAPSMGVNCDFSGWRQDPTAWETFAKHPESRLDAGLDEARVRGGGVFEALRRGVEPELPADRKSVV